MASNQLLIKKPGPLAMMTKLSPFVSVYEPAKPETGTVTTTSAPKLIIMASWMDAQDVHIAKYLTQYQSIFPTSSVLLVKFNMRLAFSPSFAGKAVQPAVWYMRSQIDAGTISASPAKPEIFVHVFSNGGATTMHNIYLTFPRKFKQPFPFHTVVFDSCPGLLSFWTGYNAFIIGIRNRFMHMVVAPFVMAFIAAIIGWYKLPQFISGKYFLEKNAKALNDDTLVKQACRAYIFGKKDAMVDWRHIEAHARAAAEKGFNVQIERFDQSPHVSHMRMDSGRYWKIVNDTWDKGLQESQIFF
ncbi:hypothetical protein F5Y15DRAFT_344968 [Xylariaceae sp. FL0016]|nr:hypothetical protein F5Y15DRAFT_344968 [Xylariaceae sp. FL0016]